MENAIYCFEVKLQNNQTLFFTSCDQNIFYNNIIYKKYSGLNIKEALFNDSGHDYVLIDGIFEENGIDKNTNLSQGSVAIFILYENNLRLIVDYIISEYQKYDLNFILKLEPESVKFKQTIIKAFSKTCRANFGDDKCCANKASYSLLTTIKEVIGYEIILENISRESGYFTYGSAYIKDLNFHARIISHSSNIIKLDKKISETKRCSQEIELTAGCDKNFITCCNKFNNAVNFRGEPFIPEQNVLKIF